MDERDERRRAKVGNRTVLMQRSPRRHPDHDHAPPVRLPASPVEDSGPRAKATVAKGRTIIAPAPGEGSDLVGFDPFTAAPIRAPRQRAYGPGEEVQLPLSEIERLTRLGFLHDPNRYGGDEEAAALPPQPEPPVAA